MDCIEDLERTAGKGDVSELRFLNLEGALAWLRSHRSALAIGAVVIIAGVAFVVATGGSGALIRAPLAL
ncbi:hypothetical protein [Corallococcus carmarthensis]|uniref:Uncharacterized protein n=1 Tax=Corallococcus carmarthensis TaxID=2316728 RepID=A0A3A8K008_9BACT|nr:hypothetical protein [Corallococcus carmarthensis]NOK19619.1 hypothetical protein [Corallococcus carmarthensis]RKH00786.1 hypothetical protein D7X32_22555 [Corallococcus carmarthensis]